MNIFNIPEQYASFCVCGDIHGEFKTLAYNLKQQKIENAVIVVAGDCGIGFEKAVHYSLIYEKICFDYSTLISTSLFAQG